MTQNEYIINLDLPPRERWAFLSEHVDEINELLQCYLNDFEGAEFIFESIDAYKKEIISREYLEEIAFISSISKFSEDEVLIANLYYDMLKFYLGCTAFAVESDEGILHSRNLDWWTDNNILGSYSAIFDFQRGGQTVFKTIGWMGFIGALSGTKSGKFSLTLNAVSSGDKAELAMPVSFLLRDILDHSGSFKEALKRLEVTSIASDCLVLLSGINQNEMVVVERTPKRFATRPAEDGYIAVTNDYKVLENGKVEESILTTTSCGRYDRTIEMLRTRIPSNAKDCFEILKDDKVIMGITVQQMVINTNSGTIELLKVVHPAS